MTMTAGAVMDVIEALEAAGVRFGIDDDRRDMATLAEVFGVPLPESYRAP